MKKLILIAMLAMPATSVLALEVPKAGRHDHRVKYVDYNPADVVKLVGHFGYQINIVFAEGESVEPKGIFVGDSAAWLYTAKGNQVFIKPKEDGGRTNMSIVTNRRTYNFDLSSHWSKKNRSNPSDMYFQVNFRYPTDEVAKVAANIQQAAAAASAQEAQRRLDDKLARAHDTANINYTVQGSDDVAPDEASDDGTFTKLTFQGNREIPAIYLVNADGSESLANRTVEGKTVVIHGLARKFVLRKGKSVACVFNESYDPIGRGNPAGTTIPGVERVIKGESQ